MNHRWSQYVTTGARGLAFGVATLFLCCVSGCDKPKSASVSPARPQPTPATPTAPAEPAPQPKVESAAASERAKIERMLKVLGESDAVFIRNDVEHTGAEGAAHLRRKWENTGDRAATARDFIELLASTSSATGRAYQVRTSDGVTQPSREWFTKLLESIESSELTARPGK